MKQVCVIGGGNLGHVMAGVLAQYCQVTILTQRPEQWSKTLIVNDIDHMLTANIANISANPAELIPQSDIVLLCLPGYAIENTLQQIAPFITTQAVGSIVSSTGFFPAAHNILPSFTQLFGFQRVPYIARVREYGQSAEITGHKAQLYMAVENIADGFVQQWATYLQTPIAQLSKWQEAAFTNSNPLLHPARLYSLWKDWSEGIVYETQSRFYEDWTDDASAYYVALDAEFQTVMQQIGVQIPTVTAYYEVATAEEMTRKIRSIEAFKGILAPMRQVLNGYVPDFTNRYFTEDFPYGLQLVQNEAQRLNINTPMIDEILAWGNKWLNN